MVEYNTERGARCGNCNQGWYRSSDLVVALTDSSTIAFAHAWMWDCLRCGARYLAVEERDKDGRGYIVKYNPTSEEFKERVAGLIKAQYTDLLGVASSPAELACLGRPEVKA